MKIILSISICILTLCGCVSVQKQWNEKDLVLSIRPIHYTLATSDLKQPHGLFIYRETDAGNDILILVFFEQGIIEKAFGDTESSRRIWTAIEGVDLEEVSFEQKMEVIRIDKNGNELIQLAPFDGVEVEIFVKNSRGEFRQTIWNPMYYLENQESFPGVKGLNEILSVIFPIVAQNEIGI